MDMIKVLMGPDVERAWDPPKKDWNTWCLLFDSFWWNFRKFWICWSGPSRCASWKIDVPGQITTTSAAVTLHGGLARESPSNPMNSGLGILAICPECFDFRDQGRSTYRSRWVCSTPYDWLEKKQRHRQCWTCNWRSSVWYLNIFKQYHTVDGRNPEPVDMANTVPHYFQGFKCFDISQVMQDVFHEPYERKRLWRLEAETKQYVVWLFCGSRYRHLYLMVVEAQNLCCILPTHSPRVSNIHI